MVDRGSTAPWPAPPAANRRRNPRFIPLGRRMTVRARRLPLPHDDLACELHDLSSGGACASVRTRLPAGTDLDIACSGPPLQPMATARGVAVWCLPHPYFAGEFLLGIRFSAPDPAFLRRVESLKGISSPA